jgi:hypothetical protein
LDDLPHLGVVVSLVEADVLGGPGRREHRTALQCRTHELAIVPIGGSDDQTNRNTRGLSLEAPLDPLLRPVGWIGTGALSTERSLGHRAVHRLPSPAKTDLAVVVEERPFPEPLEGPGASPLLETIVGSGCRSVASRQGSPLDAGEEDVEDGLHALSVVGPGSATQRTGPVSGKERSDAFPQRVGQPEAAVDQRIEERKVRSGHWAVFDALPIFMGFHGNRLSEGFRMGS